MCVCSACEIPPRLITTNNRPTNQPTYDDQVKRALEEGKVVKPNSCSQPMVEKAMARARQAISDPSVDFFLVRPVF